ncbi:MAG: hypothetical protein V1773_05800 [bacterium]
MNLLIVLFFFVLFFNNNYAQDKKNESDSTYIVELKEFYDGKGVVFGRDVDYDIYPNNTDKRITLTKEDVIEAEKIMDSVATLYYKDDIDGKKEYDSKLRGYFRQYWGFKNSSNEKRIMIFLYNFNNLEFKEEVEGKWDKGICLSTSDFFYTNSGGLLVNLTKRKIVEGTFYPFKLE